MKTRKEVLEFQMKLRNNPTYSERKALEILQKEGLLLGADFLFQEIFGFYILDFVFPAKRLIIELDGASHKETLVHDHLRDYFCSKHGFTTIRIPNWKAHTIFLIYSQYRKVSRASWEKMKASAEKEQFNKELTYRPKLSRKRKRKK